jgi:Fuc2NAc and GlcNAc transferase
LNTIVFLLAVFALAHTGIALYLNQAQRRGWFDIPNARSSHKRPTPSGGGLALLPAWLLGCLLLFSSLGEARPLLLASILATLIALLGWWDDRHNLSARLRLQLFFLAASIFVLSLPLDATGWILFSVIFIVGFLNAFNFMDGIDGIAMSEALFVCLAMSVLASGAPALFENLLYLLSALALSFLLWNWSPAKLFCGDAGSTFFGFLLSALIIFAHAETILPLSTSLILVAAFVADAGTTLCWRIVAGERLSQAHRTHAYQLLAQHFGAHAPVCWIYTGINLCLLLPLAYWVSVQPEAWLPALVIAYLPLLVIVSILRKRLL